MESWNNAINTALLGTEKRSLKETDVDALLAESFTIVAQQTADREDAFLQQAALIYNYRQCGFLPLNKATATITKAEAEEKVYTSSLAHALLDDVLETGSGSLLKFWLGGCHSTGKVVQPETIPVLLQAGVKTRSLQPLVSACCGKRGQWLQQFNKEWQWDNVDLNEEAWQTGTLIQRKTFLEHTRKEDASKARELLQQTWPQEPAATKVELLEAFAINATDDDVPWLEALLDEKGSKVKEAALEILKTIPSSAIVQLYWSILKDAIRIHTSKGILGIGSKISLEITLGAIDASLFKTGIQQVSSQKNTSDETFILQQLIASVPPHLWEARLALSKEEVVKLFLKDKAAKTFILSFVKAAVRFKNAGWIKAIIEADKVELYPSAFALLPQPDAEAYALPFLSNAPEAETIIQYLASFPDEWSHAFTLAILPHLARFPQQFHRNFYSENIHRFPVSIIPFIDSVKVTDQYAQQVWNNVSEHLKQLLTLKQQIIKAFSD